ncbi:hypothetical protein FHG87_006794 [Trinorchestia longiramus]|nr:hypothetical protein FHG87_006794 [Trinorchestia longiramus]
MQVNINFNEMATAASVIRGCSSALERARSCRALPGRRRRRETTATATTTATSTTSTTATVKTATAATQGACTPARPLTDKRTFQSKRASVVGKER